LAVYSKERKGKKRWRALENRVPSEIFETKVAEMTKGEEHCIMRI
jgi:hypothetical protein